MRCQAVEPFGTTGALGTPGAANSPCFEYSLKQVPPAFEDISTTGRKLFFGNFDEEFDQVTLTAPIRYFGSDFTSVGISANGFVSFTQLAIAGLTNRTIPGSGLPESTVAPFWDDLNANTTFSDSSVFVEQLPATPPRRSYDSNDVDKAKRWRDIWAAGQGVGAVKSVAPVAQIVAGLRREYLAAGRRFGDRLLDTVALPAIEPQGATA